MLAKNICFILKWTVKNKDSLYTVNKAIENIKIAFDELETIEEKYSYSNFSKDM